MTRKLLAVFERIPGRTLRRDLMMSLVPSLTSFVRAAMKLCMAGGMYLTGHRHAALIVAVMSGMMLIGAIEGQAARAFAKSVPRVKTYLQQRRQKQLRK